MYEINNKILPKTEHRQKIFNELIHFGYTKSRIKEYSLLRECEIANFGMEKIKNTNIKEELKNMLTAFSVQAYFKNVNLFFEIVGNGQGYFFAERLEYYICRLISDCIKNSVYNSIFLKVKITNKKIRLTVHFEGKPIKNLSKNVYEFCVGKNVVINFKDDYIPSKKIIQKPKEVYEWISDRLSDVNVSLIDF